MKVSIITINYNNSDGLRRTIESVVNQNSSDFEYIVIDGASTDGSVDTIKKYADKINYWVSEPDKGIYNAMNKGIKQAKGEYLLFINSGDCLYNKSVIRDILSQNIKTDLIYGNLQRVYQDGTTDIVHTNPDITVQYMLGDTIPHPVTLIRAGLFDKYGLYREDMRVISDWAFFLKIIVFGRVTRKHIPQVVASFSMDGISNDPENVTLIEKETETVFKDYFSTELLDICTSYNKYYSFYHNRSVTWLRKISYGFRKIFSIKGWKQLIYRNRIKPLIGLINTKVRQQKQSPSAIPIIIISYNRLNDLKKLVSFLLERKHKNIIIVDNKSTYAPLLNYYDEIKDKVTIKMMDRNYGHLVFWKNRELYNEYASGYYIVTDSDIIPNNDLPADYITFLRETLDKNDDVTKVGFALRIDNIPDSYQQKRIVTEWEEQFWQKEKENNMYMAGLDTTFAIYPPYYDFKFADFYPAIRVAGNFTAEHGGWYIDSENLTDEDKYYFSTSNSSNSWKVDENGKFAGQSELYERLS